MIDPDHGTPIACSFQIRLLDRNHDIVGQDMVDRRRRVNIVHRNPLGRTLLVLDYCLKSLQAFRTTPGAGEEDLDAVVAFRASSL